MRYFTLVFTFIFCFSAFAQNELPKGSFISPLEVPLVLSGTFGELRSNHFHSGLDIKTQQRTGLNVLATASGTVNRIKIERYGYGKALYIDHGNGYTSVYAHLEKFSPEIEAYVKKHQYENESYEIQLFPNPTDLRVEQGELIAYSGNSGGSGGPHLHFEIRDANARPMNPMLFGIDIKDSKPPVVKNLYVYPLSPETHIEGSNQPKKLRIYQQPDKSYKSENITAFGKIGFAVGAIDQQDAAYNQNGLYAVKTKLNGADNLNVTMDRFSFAETRYINRMIDYELYQRNRSRVQKLFLERNNPLSIYSKVRDRGVLQLEEEGASAIYDISLQDFAGNTTTITVPITIKADSTVIPSEEKKTPYYVMADGAANFSVGKFDVYVPKGAFYDDYYLDISADGENLKLHKDVIPVQKNMTISFDASTYAEVDREKLYIASQPYPGATNFEGAKLDGNKLIAYTRSLGNYTIASDNDPPKINPAALTEGKWMSNYKTLDFTISDSGSGIDSYRATINGKFVLMEYDYKTKKLVYNFENGVSTETENDFKLIVTDNVGNSTTFTATFFRK
ncbi:MAG: M23 family metallopeptidase [Leeuwenhoekiella sp.]